jgi:single-strand DNA-binding protein
MDQKIEARGTVVRDPELRTTSSGNVLTRVTIAADEVMHDGEKVDAKQNKWQTAVFWGQDAKDYAQNIKKGAQVRLVGDLVRREYTDKDGERRSTAEIQRGRLVVEPAKERVTGPRIEAKGTVVRDPELKTTSNGKAFARITVAADELTRDGQALDPKENKWQNAVFWGKEAEQYARSVKKGSGVRLCGELVQREYTDSNGAKRISNEIHRGTLEMLDLTKNVSPDRAGQAQQAEMSR